MAEWKDTTSYSRDDKERKPRCWTLGEGPLRVVLLNNNRFYPGEYVISCYGLNIEAHQIGLKADVDLEVAKGLAIRIVQANLRRYAQQAGLA